MSPNLKWSDSLPTDEGWYWFYGELHMGEMRMDYKDDYIHKPEMTLVKVVKVLKNMVIAEGHFVNSNKFDKENRKSGWLGYWANAELPEGPYDGKHYFNKPLESK